MRLMNAIHHCQIKGQSGVVFSIPSQPKVFIILNKAQHLETEVCTW